jgi:sugar phosphate isomerase/epimerase
MHTEKNIGVALGKSNATERERGVQWLAENCRLASLLGTKILVLHLWGWPELDDHLENNLSLLSQCTAIAEHYGLILAIETIPCRHADPLSNVHRAVERDARCHVALDTEFLAQANQLDEVFTSTWLWTQQRVQHTHIKDFDGHSFTPDGKRRYLHPGEGTINFTHFFNKLKQCKYDGYISLESPAIDANGLVDIARLQKSLRFVKKLMVM